MKLSIIKLFFVIFTISFFTASEILSQSYNPSYSIKDSTFLSISPENPRIGEDVVITVYSDLFDLNQQKISWYINKSLKKEGVGLKSVVIKNESNSSTNITAIITKNDGSKTELSKEINPFEIDLIVEPISYTPPLYKGKTSFVEQGSFYVVAIPNIRIQDKKVSPKDIFFKWTKDGVVAGKVSGLGKDSIKVFGNIPLDDINIEVELYDKSNMFLAKNSIEIEIEKSEIIFYEKTPLYGTMYNKAITDQYIMDEKEELSIVAEPFFFDIPINENKYSFEWTSNNRNATTTSNPKEIVIKKPENFSDTKTKISVNIKNLSKIYQEKKEYLNINLIK